MKEEGEQKSIGSRPPNISTPTDMPSEDDVIFSTSERKKIREDSGIHDREIYPDEEKGHSVKLDTPAKKSDVDINNVKTKPRKKQKKQLEQPLVNNKPVDFNFLLSLVNVKEYIFPITKVRIGFWLLYATIMLEQKINVRFVAINKCPLLSDLDCKLEEFEHGIAKWDRKYAYMVRTS